MKSKIKNKYKKKIIAILLFINIINFFSCKENKQRTEAEKIVNEWINKEIKFPSKYQCSISGIDSVGCNKLFNSEYKIMLYIDSLGCASCKLKLTDWKSIIKEADSLFPGKLNFLFFFHPKDKRELDILFKRDNFDYPVFIDSKDSINSLNHFPDKQSYQCFLLDETNKVLMVGNPTLNPQIWKLYQEQISGKVNTDKTIKTSVDIDQTKINLGNVNIGSTATATFKVKNTGDNPLVISHVSTSCGCASAEWDKEPVKPGTVSKVKIHMKAEDDGYFNKTANIFCNIKGGPIKIIVSGNAK